MRGPDQEENQPGQGQHGGGAADPPEGAAGMRGCRTRALGGGPGRPWPIHRHLVGRGHLDPLAADAARELVARLAVGGVIDLLASRAGKMDHH